MSLAVPTAVRTMNRHALGVLEFEETLRTVAARAPSALGRDAVLALEPAVDVQGAQEELAGVSEAIALLDAREGWAPTGTPDARAPLRVLSVEGGVLDPPGLLLVRGLLQAAHDLREALDPDGSAPEDLPDLPRLRSLRDRLPHHPDLLGRVDEVIDEEGSIRDDASPALRALRRKLRSARAKMVERLERFLGTLAERIRVPDASVSVRDGRYVIPVRREGKSEVGGIIHGESATGATLFVEPPLAIRLMNELQELEREEAREIQRILRDLTGRLRAVDGGLEDGLAALVAFDSLWARALAAHAWDAAVPELTAPGEGFVRIVRGRHPLLVEREGALEGPVVPFDLELASDERALVVSGPNTGGKTVFLKAVGLIHLLAQSGVAPPVGPGTRIPVVRDVFADIGDEQSIAESLSTFSAHLANAMEIVEGAGPETLVLMDEMGTGTDPAEGAALARAILETLVQRGARAVVTSHLSALKRLDAEGSGIVNASLLFDPDRIAPTYQLQKGRPGRSYGLAIARRMGLPDAVLERAHAYVDSGELEIEALLSTLEEKEKELSRALAEADRARRRAEELEREAETREARVEARERTAEARAREEARQLLLEARQEVEEAIREVRAAGEEERETVEHEARRRVEEAARRQLERVPAPPGRRRKEKTPASVGPGERVRVLGSGAKGTVREVRDDRITVEVGGLRLQLPRDEVERVEGGAASSAGGGRETDPAPGGVTVPLGRWEGEGPGVRTEADLRGLRVDEVELELGRALDGAVFGNLAELRIIHGKGTGAVKARVRELLRSDRRVEEFREGLPGEGGGGVTVARLR